MTTFLLLPPSRYSLWGTENCSIEFYFVNTDVIVEWNVAFPNLREGFNAFLPKSSDDWRQKNQEC